MTAALTLLAYAGLLTVIGPRLIDRAGWTSAAPRLAIATWFTLAASVVLAVALAGVALVMPMGGFSGGATGIVATCLQALQSRYGPIAGSVLGVLGATLTWLLPALLVVAGAVVARRTSAERAGLRSRLASMEVDHALGVVVAGSPRPAAYCIPGSGGTVVVTTGAIDLLDREGLEAVLAHERAHLAGRHHSLVAAAVAAQLVLGRLPLFAALPDRVARLVELAADDAAARGGNRRVLARSLLDFAAARGAEAGALAVAGGDTVARIERLLDGPARPGVAGLGSILGGNAAAVAAPVIVAAIPVLTTVGMVCCPI
ncbi:M56 family metallopeptidase [Glycomyces xiaoerkulensis]|uniref:M56 family metallopeptidase n=1 Tax=Glycomyces xiaoerkulensis TaxID=2038139 RepID=UPI000C2650E1|nr:M56 family metallopeptidase [Glycomyces xiaoerkulensis]